MHSVRMDRLQWPQWQRMITQREGTRCRLLSICRKNTPAVVAAEVIRFKQHHKNTQQAVYRFSGLLTAPGLGSNTKDDRWWYLAWCDSIWYDIWCDMIWYVIRCVIWHGTVCGVIYDIIYTVISYSMIWYVTYDKIYGSIWYNIWRDTV